MRFTGLTECGLITVPSQKDAWFISYAGTSFGAQEVELQCGTAVQRESIFEGNQWMLEEYLGVIVDPKRPLNRLYLRRGARLCIKYTSLNNDLMEETDTIYHYGQFLEVSPAAIVGPDGI